jgi:NAD/NADP transhydrogenase alpha subunit
MFGQAIPMMMMTAAGTVPAARTFIMGVGVAGLQAIATARLGAIVSATDVREVNWDDEIVKGKLVAKDGKIVHPSLQQTGA